MGRAPHKSIPGWNHCRDPKPLLPGQLVPHPKAVLPPPRHPRTSSLLPGKARLKHPLGRAQVCATAGMELPLNLPNFRTNLGGRTGAGTSQEPFPAVLGCSQCRFPPPSLLPRNSSSSATSESSWHAGASATPGTGRDAGKRARISISEEQQLWDEHRDRWRFLQAQCPELEWLHSAGRALRNIPWINKPPTFPR